MKLFWAAILGTSLFFSAPEEARSASKVGMNFQAIDHYSATPFVNYMTMAGGANGKRLGECGNPLFLLPVSGSWSPYSPGSSECKEFESNIDKNGYPSVVPNGTYAAFIIGKIPYGKLLPNGTYYFLYQGEADIRFDWDANESARFTYLNSKVIVLNVTSTRDTGILGKIYSTNSANPPRNFALIHQTDASRFLAGEIFRPEFINEMKPLSSVVRYMDMQKTNNSLSADPSDIITENHISQAGPSGVSPDHIIRYSKLTNSNPWIQIPVLATDAYVTRMAEIFRDGLKGTGLAVRVGYTNEVWNGQFTQDDELLKMANQRGVSVGAADWQRVLDMYSIRLVEILRIFKSIASPHISVIGVVEGQGQNYGVHERVLKMNNAAFQTLAIPGAAQLPLINEVAGPLYFGHNIGNCPTYTCTQAEEIAILDELLTLSPDEVLMKVYREEFEDLTKSAESLKRFVENVRGWEQRRNMKLTATGYEGGQHLVSYLAKKYGGKYQNIYLTLADANRHAWMGQLYDFYFQYWFNIGGGVFAHFYAYGDAGPDGFWGTLEYMGQGTSSKYEALKKLAIKNTQ